MTHHTDGEERGPFFVAGNIIPLRDRESQEWAAKHLRLAGVICGIKIYELEPVEAAPHGKTRTKTKDR